MDIQSIKQRFGIIGNSSALNRAIDIAVQVAPTDLSVLVTGESGVGKEYFPQIIHQFSARKHGPYIAVNCGAIPEGTIDSELFGHEKGSFTGATDSRKGYFEVAGGGTIFLDEVAELPLSTQVRLLRVLETGEYIKVGSSKIQKTDVRVVAATNVNVAKAIASGKFREDLYYRLNTVPIFIPALRERREDIYLLFRKFANDFAEKYRMPSLQLDEAGRRLLENYNWPGNIRQLKNITEQISVIEKERNIDASVFQKYLPDYTEIVLPSVVSHKEEPNTFGSEREILYKILFDMKADMTDLKKLVVEILQKGPENTARGRENDLLIRKLYQSTDTAYEPVHPIVKTPPYSASGEYKGSSDWSSNIRKNSPSVMDDPANLNTDIEDTEEFIEESLSLADKEKELISKALEKHGGKRKNAAQELGISERTLYRKIKEFNIE